VPLTAFLRLSFVLPLTSHSQCLSQILSKRSLLSATEESYEKKRNRWKALEQFYHALRYNRTLYNRPNLDWFFEAFDALDEDGVEVMTRQQFCNACYDLGLGMSTADLQRLVEVLDEGEDNRIDFYLVLQKLDLHSPIGKAEEAEERWKKVPSRGGPPKRRTELRNRGKKKSTGRLSQTVSFPSHLTAKMSVASTEQAVGRHSVSKTARSSTSAAMRTARSSKASAMGTARSNRSVAPGTARSGASGTLGTARSSSMD